MIKKLLLVIITLIFITASVSGTPAMVSVAPLTNGQATFNANGGVPGLAWFEWGQKSGGPYIWTTPNQTIAGGAFSDYQYGPPMLTGTKYYVRACDESILPLAPCSAELAFTVPVTTPINQTHFGEDAVQIMRSGLNVTKTAGYLVKPFGAPFPSAIAPAVSYGLIFFFIFSGMWLRGRDMLIPMMLVMVSGFGLIWGGTGLGIPPDFITYVGQPLLYLGIAGVIFSWFTR